LFHKKYHSTGIGFEKIAGEVIHNQAFGGKTRLRSRKRGYKANSNFTNHDNLLLNVLVALSHSSAINLLLVEYTNGIYLP
jgi:hypothetical protein